VNNSTNCRMATYITFREMLSQDRMKFIRYRRRSFAADSANLLANCYATAEAGADTLLKPILRLQDEFNDPAIEVSQWKNLNLKHASFTKYDTSVNPVGVAYPGRTQLINLQATSGSFTPAAVSGSSIAKDSRYLDETVYKFSTGNPQQVIPHDGVPNAYVWDYLNKEPIAKAVNATVDQIAYTSFEADGSGSWTIPSGTRDRANAITGTSSYNLSNGAISRSGLTSGNAYIVSYWSKTGSSYTVTGSTAAVQGKTINGWTYFEHTVTGTGSVVVSSPGGGDIDELRLYPASAQMTTYCYMPLVGMTSSCDIDNRVTYYTYDALGRLSYIKDQDGNIIKTLEYHYMGQTPTDL
jgi:YD repeat-containing protein